ncbi:MAG: hypothetical protein ACTHLO_14510 [Pseudolabrys sp.]
MNASRAASVIAILSLPSCGFLPGFALIEQPFLYDVPVSTVATQVACEIQDFVTDYQENHPSNRWRLSEDSANVTLILQTDHSGSVNFTGVNLANAGLQSVQTIVASQNKISTLGAKLNPRRSTSATSVFSVPQKAAQASKNDNEGAGVSVSHCPDWALRPDKNLYLKQWLSNYFDNINRTALTETKRKSQARSSLHPYSEICSLSKVDILDDSGRLPAMRTPCLPDQTKFTQVELKTQLVIAADFSGGLASNGAAAAFYLLPVNGAAFDYAPDYQHTIDIKFTICDNTNNGCTKQPPLEIGQAIPPLLVEQCHVFSLLKPLLSGVKAPQDLRRGSDILTCTEQGIYTEKPQALDTPI